MATFNSQMFYLGNFAAMDTVESNTEAENPGLILGTYASPELINVTVSDANNDGALSDDEMGTTAGEDISFDVGFGATTQFIDTTLVYNVTVTLGDGSTIGIYGTVIQSQDGNTFLTDYANGGSFDNLSVQSFSLTSLVSSNYTGFFADSSVDNTSVICFASGSPIDTNMGERVVETLSAGDLVRTLDNGYVHLIGVFSTPVGNQASDQPILIPQGALCNGLPNSDSWLSPQHRLMVSSPVAERMFGEKEVLISAKAFLECDEVVQKPALENMRYYHLICERHEIVFSAGYPVETFFPGDYGLKMMSSTATGRRAARLVKLTNHERCKPARNFPKMLRQKKLIERMVKNDRPFWVPNAKKPMRIQAFDLSRKSIAS